MVRISSPIYRIVIVLLRLFNVLKSILSSVKLLFMLAIIILLLIVIAIALIAGSALIFIIIHRYL